MGAGKKKREFYQQIGWAAMFDSGAAFAEF
jgi:hypothetical protein